MQAGSNIPIVPLPPNLTSPNRENGTLRVVISGVTLRMTITCDGSSGKSFEPIVNSRSIATKSEIKDQESSSGLLFFFFKSNALLREDLFKVFIRLGT